MPNYYEMLGVEKEASLDEIRAAHEDFIRYTREYPEDELQEAERAEMLAMGEEAYDVLSDESRRADYDSTLEAQVSDDNDAEEKHDEAMAQVVGEAITPQAPTPQAQGEAIEEEATKEKKPNPDAKKPQAKGGEPLRANEQGLMIGVPNVGSEGMISGLAKALSKYMAERREKKSKEANQQATEKLEQAAEVQAAVVQEQIIEQQKANQNTPKPTPSPGRVVEEVERHEAIEEVKHHLTPEETLDKVQTRQATAVAATAGVSPQQVVREARSDQTVPKEEVHAQRGPGQRLLTTTADTHSASTPFTASMPAPESPGGGWGKKPAPGLSDDNELRHDHDDEPKLGRG